MLAADIVVKSYQTDHLTGEDRVRGANDPEVLRLLRSLRRSAGREGQPPATALIR
jgi:hypothetical protein